jgi:hypothetical protein
MGRTPGGPPRHHTVAVRRQEQPLAPGVQRREDPRPGAEICGLAPPLQPRVVHAGQQPLGHPVDGGLPQRLEFVGHGKADLIMLPGSQADLVWVEPARHLDEGAGRAHPLATGMVPDAFHMPLRTGLDGTTEPGRATRQDRPHGTTYSVRSPMRARIGLITSSQDLLARDRIRPQGLSIPASASLHHAWLSRHLPRRCGSVQRSGMSRARFVARRLHAFVSRRRLAFGFTR